ncbi:MAG TPA: hypothetical protein VN203_29135, partial [Candidatus Acidoferrum sp.]|nr:hypothetical protein [Candidatus Acidoferrum sp.]
MSPERNDGQGEPVGNPVLRESFRQELERDIRQAIEKELHEVLDQELRERVVARLKAELAEEIQTRIARLKAEMEVEIQARMEPRPSPRELERFSWNFRAQHWVLLLSCLALIITGLPLKFHEAGVSQLFFDLVGGVGTSTLIHRIGAVGLMAVGAYHLLYLVVFREGRRNFMKLLPVPQDALDFFQMIRYFLG